MIRAWQTAACFALCLGLPALVAGMEFEMQTQTKCIYEEINANVLVVGEYKAFNKDNPSLPIYVDVRVGGLAPARPAEPPIVHGRGN